MHDFLDGKTGAGGRVSFPISDGEVKFIEKQNNKFSSDREP